MSIIDHLRTSWSVDLDPARCGGKPTLKGTRVTIAQILSELSEHCAEMSKDLDLNEEDVIKMLNSLASFFDRRLE